MDAASAARLARPQRGTARAVRVIAPGDVRLERQTVRDPAAGEVLIRLEGCGVCGSNLPVWEGRDWFDYPLEPGAPGHEGWGIIAAVGDGVDGLAAGDRVAALSCHAFAEFDIADAPSVVRLPDALAAVPFPGEPLGCAMNVFRRSDIRQGQTVAIIGIGFLGALLTQLATRAGAEVVAISRRAFSLDVARMCGASECIPLVDQGDIAERMRERTGGTFCDRVIEATGEQAPLDLAGELTRERGRLIIAGFHQDGPRQINMFLWNWRGIDVINAHEREPQIYVQGIHDAVAALAAGVMDPAPLYTHRFPLDQAGAALDMMRRRPAGFMKALVEP
jgi:threonine dehydrogenase-like Zn-dependent dehydrogenase